VTFARHHERTALPPRPVGDLGEPAVLALASAASRSNTDEKRLSHVWNTPKCGHHTLSFSYDAVSSCRSLVQLFAAGWLTAS